MEIFQNTLIKLIVRQGTDSDRRSIVLNSGELGYSTDTERLYIGNGALSGGSVTGNLYKGTSPDITTLAPCVVGDMVFDSDKNKLYRLKENDGSALEDWELVGGVYTSGDNLLDISADNEITLNLLSAYSVDNDLLLSPVTLSAGKISLSPLSAYHISENAVESPLVINNGKLSLGVLPISSVSTTTATVSGGLVVTVNGVSKTGTPFNPLSSNYLIESNQIYARYDGLSSILDFSKNITTVDKLSTGCYRFNYLNRPTSYMIPTVQFYGDNYWDLNVRTTGIDLSSCFVKVLSSDSTPADATVTLLINY